MRPGPRALPLLLLLAGCVGPAPMGGPPGSAEHGAVPMEVHGDQMVRDAAGFLHVLGEARNPSDEPAIFVLAHVVLLDERGARLAERAVPTLRHVVPPGQRAPFDVVFTEDVPAARYVLEVSGEVFDGTRVPPPTLLPARLVEGPQGTFVTGLVRNDHDREALNVRVVATFYGEDGKVVAAQSLVPDRATLRPEETAAYESTPLAARPASWNVTAQGGYR